MPECLIEQTGTILFRNVGGKDYFISAGGVSTTINGDFIVSRVGAGLKDVKVKEEPDGQLKIIQVEVLPCDTSVVNLR